MMKRTMFGCSDDNTEKEEINKQIEPFSPIWWMLLLLPLLLSPPLLLFFSPVYMHIHFEIVSVVSVDKK